MLPLPRRRRRLPGLSKIFFPNNADEYCLSACCIVEVSDPGFRVGDDDAFLDGIEHGFQETFLLRQAQKIILHVFRPDAAETLDQFFKKARFHKLTLR